MSKLLILACFVLLLTLSKAAPILDEEVEYIEEEDDQNAERLNDSPAKEGKDDGLVTDDLGGNDDDGDDDSDDGDEEDDDFEGKVEVHMNSKQDEEDAEKNVGQEKADEQHAVGVDTNNNDQTTDANTQDDLKRSGVVEDSNGAVKMENEIKKNDDDKEEDDKEDDDKEDDDQEDDEGDNKEDDKDEGNDKREETAADSPGDGGNLQSITKSISKLQSIFNVEMPKEIESLKSESSKLKDDLNNLDRKLEDFMKQNDKTTQDKVTSVSERNDETQQNTNRDNTTGGSNNSDENNPTAGR